MFGIDQSPKIFLKKHKQHFTFLEKIAVIERAGERLGHLLLTFDSDKLAEALP